MQDSGATPEGVAGRIVLGALSHGGGLLSVSDIAYAAGVAASTVRRHLPRLIGDGYLKYTSYTRYYGLGPRAQQLAQEADPGA
jgi:DNA-binding IclR family transcriptional regulator